MKTFEIKKILVPIDYSKVSLNALDTAIEVCRSQEAELTIMHVIENSYVLLPPDAVGFSVSVLSEATKSANESLIALAREIRWNHSLVVDHIVQVGNPADEICRWAMHRGSDLVIMGTHGTSGLREFFLGSNTYRVVKNAACPVMTIPGANRWMDFRKILFPIRMVPNALDKYDIVRPIIRKNGSSVLIAGIVKKSDTSTLIEMKALTEYVRVKMEEDDVICGCEVHYTENVARHVLDLSKVEKPDLIVITATLDESIRDFFLGPYTQEIVNHSRFPVLSIRPDITNGSVGFLSKSIIEAFDDLYQK